MSGVASALASVAGNAAAAQPTALFRGIYNGPFNGASPTMNDNSKILADCILEERHDDSWVITEHPVEQGSVIADHVFKNPAVVTLTYLFTFYGENVAGSQSYLRDLYQGILNFQAPNSDGVILPFNIITGKRFYQNMLFQNISVTTDKNSENILSIRVTCKELIIVSSSTVQLSNTSDPPSLGDVVPQGTGTPVNNNQQLANILPAAVLTDEQVYSIINGTSGGS